MSKRPEDSIWTPRLRPRRDPRLRLLGSVASLRRPRRSAVPVEQKDGRFPETKWGLAVASGADHACCAPDVEGLVKAVDGPGRGREPTASSNPCRLTSWTGWPIPCRYRESTGTGITGCSLRIANSGPPSRHSLSGTSLSAAMPGPAGHAAHGHSAAGGDSNG